MGAVTPMPGPPASEALVLPRSRPLTRADLEPLPDDGHRYELIDGVLIVSPAPRMLHQRAVVRLIVLLDRDCPDELEVFTAPFDVALADDTVMEPDVLIARRADLSERDLPSAPLLAVEVVSPSTRRIHLTLKLSRLEEAGCPSYWVVDPDEPSITAWELHDGTYVETAHVTGDATFSAELPYPISLTAAQLVD